MKKSLLFIAVLVSLQVNMAKAQSLFTAPDTICIKQPVYLTNNVTNAGSYYWGFCSGYLKNDPVGANLGAGFSFDNPGAIDVANDNGHYYGFVANRASRELLRLDFGNSLGNTPSITNLGSLNNTVPINTNAIQIVKDTAGKWFMFACGGTTATNASFARFDFTNGLGNNPNSVNFGNPSNLLKSPRGLSIGFDGFNYYGFIADSSSNELIRLNFGNNLSYTPVVNSFGNIGGLFGPSDIALIKDAGNWYMLITNQVSSTVSLLTLGNTLSLPPVGVNIGNLNASIFEPTSLVVLRDCGVMYAYITSRLNNSITSVAIPNITGAYTPKILPMAGAMSGPTSMSTLIRDRDNLYTYVTNTNNTLTQIKIAQCTDPTILSSTSKTPPVYKYNTPGIYNVYLAINEGKPDMQVECHQIVVLPQPKITISNDTNLCQGDSIYLYIQSPNAMSYTWRPYYNISDTLGTKVRIWPEYSLSYFINIPYPNGCIVDTQIRIHVSKVKADAGPDRFINDGASTVLGGPLTTTNGSYVYNWSPRNFLNNELIPNPSSSPAYDITYYLEVTELNDNLGCKDIDTVIVHIGCNDLNLPNAFVPDGSSGSNSFGLLNRQIVKLNYFRIYDRWGELVFTTTDPSKQWDGKIDGKEAPMSVYVWEADGFCVTGARIKKKGNVTLIR